jgi:hypothetical protein
MSNELDTSKIEIIDGTQSVKSYLVVQHKKDAILAIKPEVYKSYEGLVFCFRQRIIADPGSVKGIENRQGYCTAIYPQFDYTKNDLVRATFCLTAVLPKEAALAFSHAENGKELVKRLIYKMVSATVNHIQGLSGAPFDDQLVAIEWLTGKFANLTNQLLDYFPVNEESMAEIESMDTHELFQLPFLN